MFKAVITIHSAVIVYQNTYIIKNSFVTFISRAVLIAGQQLERSLRVVTDTDTSQSSHNIHIKIVFSIFFHTVRCIQLMIRPGSIRCMVGGIPCLEAGSMALPVIQVA